MPDLSRTSEILCRIRHFRFNIIMLFLHHFVNKTLSRQSHKGIHVSCYRSRNYSWKLALGVILPLGYLTRVKAKNEIQHDCRHHLEFTSGVYILTYYRLSAVDFKHQTKFHENISVHVLTYNIFFETQEWWRLSAMFDFRNVIIDPRTL